MSRLKQAQQDFSTFWSARTAQERKMLTAAMAVIVLAGIYALLIEPAWLGRNQLTNELPVLRQQVAQLQVLTKEAASLADKPVILRPTITQANLENSLANKGLKPQELKLSGDRVQVKLSAASYSSTLGWLAEMQSDMLLVVIDANIKALTQPNMVDATITLHQQRNE
ncbi:MAG: type II secretion system protein GspM [Gallionella sp.]